MNIRSESSLVVDFAPGGRRAEARDATSEGSAELLPFSDGLCACWIRLLYRDICRQATRVVGVIDASNRVLHRRQMVVISFILPTSTPEGGAFLLQP